MKKQIAILSVLLVGFISGLFYYTASNSIKKAPDDSAEVEALSDLESWWNRLDYVCVKVECNCIFYQYTSEVAQAVDAGTGTVAHTWSCTGCGDCGWTTLK